MNPSRVRQVLFAAFGIMLVVPGVAHAGVFRDIGMGLGYVGFNVQGQRNVLSGGIDFSINRNFVGKPLDFGIWDLAMAGPLALEVSTGGRLIPQVDIRLATARLGGGAASPLSYQLNYDLGAQSVQIDGTLLLDVDMSLNVLGFYDLTFNYETQQEVVREGMFVNDEQSSDFQFEPINVSGNIFVDVLAVLTQPIFDQAGVANPLASLGGRAKPGMLTQSLLLAALAAGDNPIDLIPVDLRALNAADSVAFFTFQPMLPPGASSGLAPAGVVPEPSVLILMLLGAPLILRRFRH